MRFYKNLRQRINHIIACIKEPGRGSSSTYVKYPSNSQFSGAKVLNVGCGSTIYQASNVVNLDMFPSEGVNVVHDLSKMPLPFESESFDFIIANHILEHVPGWWECFKELARVLKKGGLLEVWGPGDGSSTQLGYRDHLNIINACSFTGIKNTNRNKANLWEKDMQGNAGEARNLECIRSMAILCNYWWIHIWPQGVLNWMGLHLRNVVQENGFLFKKVSA